MSYVILGRQIASEWLALGTFGTVGLGTWAAMRKPAPPPGAPKVAKKEPPVEASSKEEEDFIRQFVAEAEKSEGGHH